MKNIDIKVMERRIQTIIGNGKPSTLSKDFIQKKKNIFLTNLHHLYEMVYLL